MTVSTEMQHARNPPNREIQIPRGLGTVQISGIVGPQEALCFSIPQRFREPNHTPLSAKTSPSVGIRRKRPRQPVSKPVWALIHIIRSQCY